MRKPDGGSAFPDNDDVVPQKGMTLRDWFAGQVLSGFAAACKTVPTSGQLNTIAQTAYAFADALIAERDNSRGNT